MKYIDTHAHVNFNAYKDDSAEVMERTLAEGVGVINVGSQYSTSKRAIEMADAYADTFAAVGIHPLQLVDRTFDYREDGHEDVQIKTIGEEFDYEKYLEFAKDDKVVAIGEVGLDYHHFEEGDDVETLKKKQKETLLGFIKIANEVGKPVMIHCWDAYTDLLDILEKSQVEKRGVIHSFIGSYKTAKKFTELGYKIGMNGIVTYSKDFERLIREVSLSDILLETDCPYLTPNPKKSERNEPKNVILVAEYIAKVKDISAEEVAKSTTENARNLFSL